MVSAATPSALIVSDDCDSPLWHSEGPSWCIRKLLYHRSHCLNIINVQECTSCSSGTETVISTICMLHCIMYRIVYFIVALQCRMIWCGTSYYNVTYIVSHWIHGNVILPVYTPQSIVGAVVLKLGQRKIQRTIVGDTEPINMSFFSKYFSTILGLRMSY